MHIFVPALEVGDTEGFTLEKDIFGRASLGLGMTNLLSSISDPVVLALDGQWGSGKTTFLKMWAGELRKAGFPVVYLDAFRNDYEDDPFMAVAGEIIALADAQRKADTAAAKVFIRKAIGAGKVILRSGLKLGVKAATLGALDTADLEGVASDWAKEASELEDKYLGELLTKHGEQKKAIQAFQDALADLPGLLSPNTPEGSDSKPLVIIIDELDRCRPVFALQVLERIKHFFSAPKVHFVLGAHLGQLSNSVKAAYGADIDSHLYCRNLSSSRFT
jgi:predicted KAP-like P-loop ATPase